MSEGDPYKMRVRFKVAPILRKAALLGEARKLAGLRPITLKNRMHNATHAHQDKIIGI